MPRTALRGCAARGAGQTCMVAIEKTCHAGKYIYARRAHFSCPPFVAQRTPQTVSRTMDGVDGWEVVPVCEFCAALAPALPPSLTALSQMNPITDVVLLKRGDPLPAGYYIKDRSHSQSFEINLRKPGGLFSSSTPLVLAFKTSAVGPPRPAGHRLTAAGRACGDGCRRGGH